MHYGIQKLGARVVPASGGNTERQIKLMKDLGATVLACTPSFAVYLAETMVKAGIRPQKRTQTQTRHIRRRTLVKQNPKTHRSKKSGLKPTTFTV